MSQESCISLEVNVLLRVGEGETPGGREKGKSLPLF